jgi:hypothetical protein
MSIRDKDQHNSNLFREASLEWEKIFTELRINNMSQTTGKIAALRYQVVLDIIRIPIWDNDKKAQLIADVLPRVKRLC